MEKGWFRQELSLAAPPNVPAILRTLREVAAGMEYVHAQSIIHRDLTGACFLSLSPSIQSPHGCTAGSLEW